MKAISCREIIKSFGEPPLVILKSLSFDIEYGEFVGVTGRSGSGKSTLLYSVSGLDKINSGTVHISGKDVHSMGEKETHEFRNRKFGFVFQFHYLLPEISALENILMPARKIREEKNRRKKAVEFMEEFEISHCRNKLPSQMSGGEMQRTAIARSLIMEPEFLFADEPTGNLDTENGEKVMNILKRVNTSYGTTILMVTHEPDFAAMASRQIHLIDGTIDYDSSGRKK
ncbi:MAG TPA: ABC transporter ATP-binding protein [Spirochaetota bacterium]|nr:ABC transporter ATP-binding protein [Spirochaetota bacterium]HPJ34174.1 ABC transporter ATP-binding protein [Spirochaetota bacterium]